MRLRRFVVALALVLLPRPGRACGLTPPIGPNGLPTECHGDAGGPRWRAGLTAGGVSTKIAFRTGRADLLESASAVTLDFFPLERLGLSASLGAALAGRVDFEGRRYTLSPGPLGGVGVSYLLFGGAAPFVHASFTYSVARATARAPDGAETTFTSRDYRLGLAVGKSLGKVAAPFVVGRYFGAGTQWAAAGGHGADAYRYHVGLGSAFQLSERIDALAELTVLGERRLSLGAGYRF